MSKEKILQNKYTVLAQCLRDAADAVELSRSRRLAEMLQQTTPSCTITPQTGD